MTEILGVFNKNETATQRADGAWVDGAGNVIGRRQYVPKEHTINNPEMLALYWPVGESGEDVRSLSACCVRALLREVIAARRAGFVPPRLPDGDASLTTAKPDVSDLPWP